MVQHLLILHSLLLILAIVLEVEVPFRRLESVSHELVCVTVGILQSITPFFKVTRSVVEALYLCPLLRLCNLVR